MNVLWELASESDEPVTCTYQHVLPATHVITVTVGRTNRFCEEHGTETDAMEEAAYLLDHFMFQGSSVVAYRDPRIASPTISEQAAQHGSG
jgi:hypothetical protein